MSHFEELFDVELDGWCHGLRHFPGEISADLVHLLLKEMRPCFEDAVKHQYNFDILEVSRRISKASKYLVDEREIAFGILLHLPNPLRRSEGEQYTVGGIVKRVEDAYGGALAPITKHWKSEIRKLSNGDALPFGASSKKAA